MEYEEFEEYEDRKVCPFKMGGRNYSISCSGESCAWWCGKDCAVPLLARMFEV